nr:hypothetical protein CFP56_31636 [Quercus suber]
MFPLYLRGVLSFIVFAQTVTKRTDVCGFCGVKVDVFYIYQQLQEVVVVEVGTADGVSGFVDNGAVISVAASTGAVVERFVDMFRRCDDVTNAVHDNGNDGEAFFEGRHSATCLAPAIHLPLVIRYLRLSSSGGVTEGYILDGILHLEDVKEDVVKWSTGARVDQTQWSTTQKLDIANADGGAQRGICSDSACSRIRLAGRSQGCSVLDCRPWLSRRYLVKSR